MPKPYQVHDKFFRLAKERGYRARSAFKLLDIQEKFHILRPGLTVLDLGAAPGSFLQVISEIVGPKGKALGIDLEKIEGFLQPNLFTLQADIFDEARVLLALRENGFEQVDVVTSDLAPKTTGIRDVDQARSAELTEQALHLALRVLKRGGHFVAKIFEGEEMASLINKLKGHSRTVKVYRPPASRYRSFERYLIALHVESPL